MIIYKYELELVELQTLIIPKNSKFLHIGAQNGIICLWAIVNPNNITEDYKIRIVGTGHEASDDLTYLGTVLMPPFVWHVFNEVEK